MHLTSTYSWDSGVCGATGYCGRIFLVKPTPNKKQFPKCRRTKEEGWKTFQLCRTHHRVLGGGAVENCSVYAFPSSVGGRQPSLYRPRQPQNLGPQFLHTAQQMLLCPPTLDTCHRPGNMRFCQKHFLLYSFTHSSPPIIYGCQWVKTSM